MGSNPTRPTKVIADWRLSIFCGLQQLCTGCLFGVGPVAIGNRRSPIGNADAAREAQVAEYSTGKREVASSILAAGSGVEVMAKILPIITEAARHGYTKRRLRIVARKLMLMGGRLRGSIAQLGERASHVGEVGGSIPPRATRSMRRSQAGKAPGC